MTQRFVYIVHAIFFLLCVVSAKAVNLLPLDKLEKRKEAVLREIHTDRRYHACIEVHMHTNAMELDRIRFEQLANGDATNVVIISQQ